MNVQYFSRSDFDQILQLKPDFTLDYTDTYNESMVWAKIQKTGLVEHFYAIAIQLSVIGYGNKDRVKKEFGTVTVNGNSFDIMEFFAKNNVVVTSKLNDKLEHDTLTPRRIIRFFRYCVNDYLMKNNSAQSYLYKKYCPHKNETMRTMIFPGVEHMLDVNDENSKDIVKVLLVTYTNLDNLNNSNVCNRIKRVLVARGYDIENI